MPINYLDNINVTGTLSASSNLSTAGSFLSGNIDVGVVIRNSQVYQKFATGTAPTYGCNSASGAYSNIGGGICNSASGAYSNVSGGSINAAANCYAFVGGGFNNCVSGAGSVVTGGVSNTATSPFSFVAGGSANSTGNYSNSFILGSSLSASRANYTYVNNLSSQGMVNTLSVSTSSLQVGSISATSGGVGSITAKMPIYNQSGAFIGYIPIYTS